MTITATGTARFQVSGTNPATTTWSSTPLVGSLLLMVVTSSRSSSLTYFGAGVGTPSTITGWNQFGPNVQTGTTTHSCLQMWRVADGTGLDTPPSIGGYTGSGGSTTGGTVFISAVEYQANVVAGQCVGSWDKTNSTQGINIPANSAAAFSNSVGNASTVSLTVASGWTETYPDTALWCVGFTPGSSYAATTTWDAAYNPFATSHLQGVKSLATATGNTFTTTIGSAGAAALMAFTLGFAPSTVRTPTQPATARIQTSRTNPQPATGTITAGTAHIGAIGATARIATSATSAPLAATARLSITGVATASIGASPGSNAISAGATILGAPWTPKILMGTGNSIEQALGTVYFGLSGDIDNGDSNDSYTIVIDGGQAL